MMKMSQWHKFPARGTFVLLLFAGFAAFSSEQAASDNNGIKMGKAVKVLEISGTARLYVEAMLDSIKQLPIPENDKELYCRFATPESLTKALAPIYIKYYSEEDLDAMIAFYSSPAGKTIVSKDKDAVKELRKVSMSWGMEVTAKVNAEKAGGAARKE